MLGPSQDTPERAVLCPACGHTLGYLGRGEDGALVKLKFSGRKYDIDAPRDIRAVCDKCARPFSFFALPAVLAVDEIVPAEEAARFSVLPVIGWTLPHGIVTSWNRAAELLYGYRRDEMLGSQVTALFPEAFRVRANVELVRLTGGETAREYRSLSRHVTGGWIEVAVTMSLVLDRAGGIVRVLTQVRGIAPEAPFLLPEHSH